MPSFHKYLARDTTTLQAQQNALHDNFQKWTSAILVSQDGKPWIQATAPKKQHARGLLLISSLPVDHNIRTRRVPLDERQITSPRPMTIRPAKTILEQFIHAALPNWKAAFTPSTVARINAIISDIT